MYYCGIDWADNHHDVVVIDETSQKLGSIRVAHTPQGLADLNTFLLGITREVEQMACIIETNHGLLITFLLEAGWPVYPVNPKTVDRKRGAAGAKTDKIDAYLLAKTGRSDLADLRRLSPDSPLVQELKELTRDQDSLIESQTRLVNQLTASPALKPTTRSPSNSLPSSTSVRPWSSLEPIPPPKRLRQPRWRKLLRCLEKLGILARLG